MKKIKDFDRFLNEKHFFELKEDLEEEDLAAQYSDIESYSMDLMDDLKSNFRDWEQDHDNESDAEELYNILRGRHNLEKPDYVRQVAYDWVGYEPE